MALQASCILDGSQRNPSLLHIDKLGHARIHPGRRLCLLRLLSSSLVLIVWVLDPQSLIELVHIMTLQAGCILDSNQRNSCLLHPDKLGHASIHQGRRIHHRSFVLAPLQDGFNLFRRRARFASRQLLHCPQRSPRLPHALVLLDERFGNIRLLLLSAGSILLRIAHHHPRIILLLSLLLRRRRRKHVRHIDPLHLCPLLHGTQRCTGLQHQS
mmetsp:Transcript_18390/g.38596  ORF Transcript_18390/g.38596 Transcript_18390/m.38596 type:complete len:213 (-) Transcript_18390:404-1042(-)